ncbi:hypothetical protein AVEN_109525-1 [Araneus ventricosus]|uniref:Uncharacterized protein n=1 Tax=Araneus ventricosus TaxID=182803 RepID=A0A4Y2LQI2_ARAVE|nr:hypothetical protein AVEN_109525-1 [Araneus ventricosus]
MGGKNTSLGPNGMEWTSDEWPPLEGERLRGMTWSFVCSASWKAGEMNAIESAVTVITSELLSVCVARSGSAVTVIANDLIVCVYNLYKCYCSRYLCFVFPEYL